MFIFSSPSRIAFSVFGLDIYYYGLLMGIAICVCLLISNYIANKYYKHKDLILEIAPLLLLLGIVGARLYYCILNWEYYIIHPFEILAIRNGGLSIHGALLGGVIGIYYYVKKYNNCNFSEVLDILSYSVPIGQAIARWGNFFNSEAFGYPTNLPWKLFIPIEARPIEYINNGYFHPTFLYESILDSCIFLIMLFLLHKKDKFKSGTVFCIYLILYSIVRIFVESFRIDCVKTILGIQVPILVSILIIIFCLFYILKKRM